jgi:hypothetical protein
MAKRKRYYDGGRELIQTKSLKKILNIMKKLKTGEFSAGNNHTAYA